METESVLSYVTAASSGDEVSSVQPSYQHGAFVVHWLKFAGHDFFFLFYFFFKLFTFFTFVILRYLNSLDL